METPAPLSLGPLGSFADAEAFDRATPALLDLERQLEAAWARGAALALARAFDNHPQAARIVWAFVNGPRVQMGVVFQADNKSQVGLNRLIDAARKIFEDDPSDRWRARPSEQERQIAHDFGLLTPKSLETLESAREAFFYPLELLAQRAPTFCAIVENHCEDPSDGGGQCVLERPIQTHPVALARLLGLGELANELEKDQLHLHASLPENRAPTVRL